jgi:cell wall-associated NlpC family hydrolase
VSALDPRRNAFRPDCADAALKGRVEAERFVEGLAGRIAIPSVPLRRRPAPDAPVDTELLFGEPVLLFEHHGDWAWLQSVADHYVGYVPVEALDHAPAVRPTDPRQSADPEATHRVHVPLALVFAEPSIKSAVRMRLPMGARLLVIGEEAVGGEHFHRTAEGFVLDQHCLSLAEPLLDWVALAETFLGAPYLFGGKTWDGIDCSALVQVAVQAAGGEAPRDSDMQEAELGDPRRLESHRFTRGDLVFWKGHVGIMADENRLLHANGHHMLTAIEPVADTLARLRTLGLEPTAVRHVAPDAAMGFFSPN